MQVTVRLNRNVEHKLASAVNATHKPRNLLINEAIEFYLDNINLDVVQEEIDRRMQVFNEADKQDELADFGDWP